MSNQEILSPEEALKEYFKLKNKFEQDMNVYKRKIINNPTLSKREKRLEFLKIKPKCINCKRPSKKGTIFSSIYNPESVKISAYRKLTASCGNLADPCNLDIEIHLGDNENLNTLMNKMREEIKSYKNKIIDDKNKLLFGLITTEEALEKFDFNKAYINDLTDVYEMYVDKMNNTVDNKERTTELDESIVLSYENIGKIKDCIKKMNENDNQQFAVDAANIYIKVLKPLLDKIRSLKYNESSVYYDEMNGNYKLIQDSYSELGNAKLFVTGYESKVIKFEVGYQATKGEKKKPGFTIVDSDEETPIQISQTINQPKPIEEIPQDEPIIGQGEDGIDWHLEEYTKLWSRLPVNVKSELKLNIDWMKDFMHKCLNAKKKEGPHYNGCRLPTPSNIIMPPKELPNGQYDFGVSIYSKSFNRQPKSLQKTYLSFYKEDPTTKERDYHMLEESMNSLVENELNFGRGFF
jgi:hypothetical protein